MKKKTELDDVNVVFDSTPLTAQEKILISEYIQQDKAKKRKKPIARRTVLPRVKEGLILSSK